MLNEIIANGFTTSRNRSQPGAEPSSISEPMSVSSTLYASSRVAKRHNPLLRAGTATFAELQINITANRVNAVAQGGNLPCLADRLVSTMLAPPPNGLSAVGPKPCRRSRMHRPRRLARPGRKRGLSIHKSGRRGRRDRVPRKRERSAIVSSSDCPYSVEWHHSAEKPAPIISRLRQIGFTAEVETLAGNGGT